MHKSLLEIMVDPATKLPLTLKEAEQSSDGQIISGTLSSSGDNRTFPITNGVPRFVDFADSKHGQAAESFGFKWQQRESYASEDFQNWYRNWLMQRYGFSSMEQMRSFFGSRRRILEVGCGSGLSASLSLSGEGQHQEWVGVDISVAIDVAKERLGHLPHANFVQADLMQLPFREQTFDTILAEGVLHHTHSTELAFRSLLPMLEAGGEILFYVYRKKAPIREFTDDYIRDIISSLDPQQGWEMMRPLTRLGQALAQLHAEVEVPEDIPYLGIKAGRYDVQRLIYWHFAKLFWNDTFTFEGNNLLNFDWYHPRYAHRHSEDEVRRWCMEAGLSITHFDAQESGFTVRAIKG